MSACSHCGGTGDLFDRDIKDWIPGRLCYECKGTGEANESYGSESMDAFDRDLLMGSDSTVAPTMSRESILNGAWSAVMKDRNLDYGAPEDNFRDIADMMTVMFGGLQSFEPHHAAIMGIIIKLSRLKTSPGKEDHWVDIAGYAACGGQAYGRTAFVQLSGEPTRTTHPASGSAHQELQGDDLSETRRPRSKVVTYISRDDHGRPTDSPA